MRFRPWVLHWSEVRELFDVLKEKKAALPGVNVISSHSANAVMQAAKEANSPVIIQVSNGGAHFYAGKQLPNENSEAEIAGAIALAHHVHQLARSYGVTVVLHSDHAARRLLPWVDGMLDADEQYFESNWQPLYSSHMIDLSEEPLDDVLIESKRYLMRMSAIGVTLETEIGVTGGEEDGVDNTDVAAEKLYTTPEDILQTYQTLSSVSPDFTIAAAFGNVHGVYKPGNVELRPEILHESQQYVSQQLGLGDNPVNFVFHGGSGSELEKIHTALDAGAVKMNIDTDTQWAYCEWVRKYFDQNADYLQGQIGNPDGVDRPNKKYYDPRVWQLEGEKSVTRRVIQAFEDLRSMNLQSP